MAKSTKTLHKLVSLLQREMPEVRRVNFTMHPRVEGTAPRVKLTFLLVVSGHVSVDMFLGSIMDVDAQLLPGAVKRCMKEMKEQYREFEE